MSGASVASNVNATAVLTQAKSVNAKATSTLNKQTSTTENDMNKANSIFAKAESIANAANQKAEGIKTALDTKIDGKKEAINKQIDDVSINEKIVNELNDLLQPKLDRKKELEEQHPELKDMDFSKLQKNAMKLQKKTKTVTVSTPQKGPGNTDKNGNVTKNESLVELVQVADLGMGDDMSYVQEYFQLCSEITQITNLLPTATTKLEQGQAKLQESAVELKSIGDSGVQQLSNLVSDTDSKLTSKANELNPLVQSQTNSKAITTQVSNSAEMASSSASSAASSTEDTSLSEQLQDIAEKLDTVSIDLSNLSDTNNTNVQTDLPKIADDIKNESMKVDSDVSSLRESLTQKYTEYIMNNITPHLGKKDGASTDLATSVDTGGSQSSKVSLNTDVASTATSAISELTGGANVGDVLTGVIKTALDEVFPGLGSVWDSFSSLFG